MSTATWTCGCGTTPSEPTCPTCGWARDAAGQPERSARRWLPLVAGMLVCTLAVDGVVVAKGLGEPTVHRVEDDDDPRTPVTVDPKVLLEASAPSELPADLGEVLPSTLPGMVTLTIPRATGPLTLEDAVSGLYADEAAEAEARSVLEDLGFARAHGAAFAADASFVGAFVWEFESASGAQDYLDLQRANSFLDDTVERTDAAYLEDEVATTYDFDGQQGLDVWYRVDQLLICVYAGNPDAAPSPDDVRPLYDEIATRLTS